MFIEMYGNRAKTCMTYGCSCGDGWFNLLNTLCYTIQGRINQRLDVIKKGYALECENEPIPQVVWKQIKEKFGALRIYYEGGDKRIEAFIDYTEILSHCVCENCGTMGYDVGRIEKGWIQHLCSDCAKEYGKKIIHDKEIVELWKKVIKSRKNPKRAWKGLDEPMSVADLVMPTPPKAIKKKSKKGNK